MLMVLPSMYKTTKVARAEIGIDSSTAPVARMLPEEQQDHEAGQHQSDQPFMQHRA